MSEVTSGDKNGMYGRHDHVHGLRLCAQQSRGKTLEEIHGEEKAADIKLRISSALSGDKNPAYGKVYNNGGKSVKGYYKGRFFRSLLEYSFMKHLESVGVDLNTDVAYECFIIPFTFDDREKTYRPDFYVKSQNIVYEVKPSYVLKRPAHLQEVKWSAAREFLNQRGLQFAVVSERDFMKIDFATARQDADVVWKEETFKYFKGTT